MSGPVKTAVIPAGGLGTRFLPATKAVPKEMLPVVDKPLIQYAVEEAHAAGIETVVFVTSRGKAAMEDHFDLAAELDRRAGGGRQADDLRSAAASEMVPAAGRGRACAPAGAARPRPCGVVRAPGRGRCALRRAAARRPRALRKSLPRPASRCPPGAWRQCRRGDGCAARRDRPLRRAGRGGRRRAARLRPGPGREAGAGRRPLNACHCGGAMCSTPRC